VSSSGKDDVSVTEDFKIKNRLGMHARPAALFVKTSSRYDCDIYVEKDGNRVSGKSIMGLMSLEASQGTSLKITAEGADASEAIRDLGALIEGKFDED
jgi:phosphocarrier protein